MPTINHGNPDGDFERQLRALWSEYINCVDRDGATDQARALRSRYIKLYQNYRKHKQWRKLLAKSE